MVTVDWGNFVLTDETGQKHQIFNHEFWYLAPSRTLWVPTDGPLSPLNFAITMHNAKKGHGIVPAAEDLLAGIDVKNPKKGDIGKAEDLLENVRLEIAAEKPTRLRCHYLNFEKEVAEYRAEKWGWQNRELVRCYLILSSGFYHYADVGKFEELVQNPGDRRLAEQYWQTFLPQNNEEKFRLEVLANSALYFPDWSDFPEVDVNSLIYWNETYGGRKQFKR